MSRTKVDGIPFCRQLSQSVARDALPANTRIIIHTVQNTVAVAAAPCVFPYPHLGISVLSVFALLRPSGGKNDVYEGKLAKRKAKEFYSFPKLRQSRSYLLTGARPPFPREYINFVSSRNSAPPPSASSPTFSSFLPRHFIQSVTEMNKVYFVSLWTATSAFPAWAD